MNREPSHEDAQLLLHLYELRREPRMREARKWFAERFHAETLEELQALCPRGTEDNASFRMLIGYWDMVASFIHRGILHQDLFFDSGQELLFVWEKLRRLVPLLRQGSGNTLTLRSLEKVAAAYIDWFNAQAPDFYPRYSEAVRASGKPAADGEEKP